jgi:hypothetical protein
MATDVSLASQNQSQLPDEHISLRGSCYDH